ncbi:MAG: hypothetical protein AAB582_01515 [Patescibacteria group bacterium]
MSSIKIIEVPPGFAPYYIRQSWVGIAIPLATEEEVRVNPIIGKIGSENDGGYIVLREKAVAALRTAGRDHAAKYWEGLPLGMYLQFKRNVCALVA